MFKNSQEKDSFFTGVDYFNRGEFRMAHHEWEQLWKIIGPDNRRNPLKVFLLLTGAYANCYANKQESVRYQLNLALTRLREYEVILSELVKVNTIYAFLHKYKDKQITVKVFNEVLIDKKGGRLHDDLGT
ncbi:MAG: DUF309 domain-containing protein [Candidatus Neomarinimicrobiota bacterium]